MAEAGRLGAIKRVVIKCVVIKCVVKCVSATQMDQEADPAARPAPAALGGVRPLSAVTSPFCPASVRSCLRSPGHGSRLRHRRSSGGAVAAHARKAPGRALGTGSGGEATR